MQERSIRTRQNILAAAREEFALKGLDGARVDEIAKRAGANKERIYAYFGDKEALYDAALQESFAELVGEEEALTHLRPEDAPQLAERIVRVGLEFHERHPYFWRLVAQENLGGGRRAAVLRGMQDETYRHLEGIYAVGQAGGIYPRDLPFNAFIFTLWSFVFFYHSNQLTMSQTLGMDLADPAVRERMVEDFLRFLRVG